ncbi:MAG: hypothetical protein JXR34_11515 [Bacteroidales bacterium]|nr:hypothetical protein [Bacteroidales bacterium]
MNTKDIYRKYLDLVIETNHSLDNFEEFRIDELNYENRFSFDGVLNIEKWEKQKIKLMFLLKESYVDKKGNGFYKIAPSHGLPISKNKKNLGTGRLFFPNILLFKEAIERVYKDGIKADTEIPDYRSLPDWESGILDSIAYFNMKKSLGKSSSNDKDIIEFAINHSNLIIEHIDLISPNVIVCNKTSYLAYKKIYEINYKRKDNKVYFKETKAFQKKPPRIYKHGQRILILLPHPSYRKINRATLFKNIIDELNKSKVFDEVFMKR